MSALNRGAAEAMVAVGANACTDITGFGPVGHLYGMTKVSGAGARIKPSALPILPEAWELNREGCIPGEARRNYDYLSEKEAVIWDPAIDEAARPVITDAQTSGGLLVSVVKEKSRELRSLLEASNTAAEALVGEIVEDPAGRIRVES